MNKPIIYRLTVQGRLKESWSAWFNGMTITVEVDSHGSHSTTLTGPVVDQTALHGMLDKVRDLGLQLVLVKRIEGEGGSNS